MDLTCLIPQLMVISMGTGQAQMVQAQLRGILRLVGTGQA